MMTEKELKELMKNLNEVIASLVLLKHSIDNKLVTQPIPKKEGK